MVHHISGQVGDLVETKGLLDGRMGGVRASARVAILGHSQGQEELSQMDRDQNIALLSSTTSTMMV